MIKTLNPRFNKHGDHSSVGLERPPVEGKVEGSNPFGRPKIGSTYIAYFTVL